MRTSQGRFAWNRLLSSEPLCLFTHRQGNSDESITDRARHSHSLRCFRLRSERRDRRTYGGAKLRRNHHYRLRRKDFLRQYRRCRRSLRYHHSRRARHLNDRVWRLIRGESGTRGNHPFPFPARAVSLLAIALASASARSTTFGSVAGWSRDTETVCSRTARRSASA